MRGSEVSAANVASKDGRAAARVIPTPGASIGAKPWETYSSGAKSGGVAEHSPAPAAATRLARGAREE